MLISLFQSIISYELHAVSLKNLIDKQTTYKIPLDELTHIQVGADKVYEHGHDLLTKIN